MSEAEFDTSFLKELKIDWGEDSPSSTPEDIVLLEIAHRYSGIAEATKGANYYSPLKLDKSIDELKLALTTPSYGNELAIAMNGTVPMGYFNPAKGDFTVYPELVTPEDFEILRDSANHQRNLALEKFNLEGVRGATRMDYSHPIVQRLHYDHANFFIGTGIAEEIAKEFNDSPKASFNNYLELDSATHCVLTLKTRNATSQSSPCLKQHYMALRFMGSYTEFNGEKIRRFIRDINIAERIVDSNGQHNGFKFKPIDGLVEDDQLDELTKPAIEVLAAEVNISLEGMKFDTENLAMMVSPMISPQQEAA